MDRIERARMAQEIEEAASANSGIDMDSIDEWAVPDWEELSDDDFSIIYSMVGGKALRLGLLEAMNTIIDSDDSPVPSVTVFLTDVAHHADYIWGEVEDKPYIDDENIAYLAAQLPQYRLLLPSGVELTKHEEAMIILMGGVIPAYASRKKFYGDILRFARSRSIADAHLALQLHGNGTVARIVEVESLLDGHTSSLTTGAL